MLCFALLALAGEQALGHHHAFSEVDLAPHSLSLVQQGEHARGAHYDRAADARHDACPACALGASPSGPPSALALLALPVETDLGSSARVAPPPSDGERHEAPARGPPAA